MLKCTADRLAEYMVARKAVDPALEEVISYGFECIMATSLQMFMLLAAALPFGAVGQTAAFLLGFASLKRWIGGYHAGSHFACLVQGSLLTLLGTLAAAKLTSPADPLICGALLAAVTLAVFKKAPVTHPNRPKSPEEKRKLARTARLLALMLLLALPAAAWRFESVSAMALACSAGAFSAALTLFIPSVKERRSQIL